MTLHTLARIFSIYLLTPWKRSVRDYRWREEKISAILTPTVHPNTHISACRSLLSPLSSFPSHSVHPFLLSFISCSPAIPVSFLCSPCQTLAKQLLALLSFQQSTNLGPTDQNLRLCPDSIISLISNNSQGRRFPSLPRWSCNSFMMVTGCFHNIQPKSSWQINKSVN